MTTTLDVVNRSVTKTDTPAMFNIFSGLNWSSGDNKYLPDLASEWSQERDVHLRATVRKCGYWATAVQKAVARISASEWEVDSDVPLRVKKGQELFLAANTIGHMSDGRLWGNGWQHFLAQHLQSYILTDNGAFVEVIYRGGQVIGFMHLDPSRCQLTGDIRRPVIYTSGDGVEHEMPAHTVFHISDMPSMLDADLGRGQCAAYDVYDRVRLFSSIQTYLFEKVSGRNPTQLVLVGGMTGKQLSGVTSAAQNQAESKGVQQYMGSILAAIPTDSPLSEISIQLAGLPENFNLEQEWTQTTARYASRLGLDPEDLAAQRIGGYGSGGQARVREEKARTLCLSAWQWSFCHQASFYLLDATTKFTFSEVVDVGDEMARAEVADKWADVITKYVEGFILTPDMGRQVASVRSDETGIPVDLMNGKKISRQTALSDTDNATDIDRTPAKEPAKEPKRPVKKKPVRKKDAPDFSVVLRNTLRKSAESLRDGHTDRAVFCERSKDLVSGIMPWIYRYDYEIAEDTPLAEDELLEIEKAVDFHVDKIELIADAILAYPDDLGVPMGRWAHEIVLFFS